LRIFTEHLSFCFLQKSKSVGRVREITIQFPVESYQKLEKLVIYLLSLVLSSKGI